MARDRGWHPSERELDWNDTISAAPIEGCVAPHWLDVPELALPEPSTPWEPAKQLIDYLRALFEEGDHVAYVTESFLDKDKRRPTRGYWDRTAGQLIAELRKCGGDIGRVLGDYDSGWAFDLL